MWGFFAGVEFAIAGKYNVSVFQSGAAQAHDTLGLLQFLVRNNFYVLIDDHSEDPTVKNDPNTWVTYWAQLMTDIQADPTSRNRVMVDPLNEPDHASLKWDQVLRCPHDSKQALPRPRLKLTFRALTS